MGPSPKSHGPQDLPRKARGYEPGTSIGVQGLPSMPAVVASLPDLFGLVYGDGFQRMRHVVRSRTFPTGLLPPKSIEISGAPTDTSPLISGGVTKPVFIWDTAGAGFKSSGSQRLFILTKGEPAENNAWVFILEIVDTLLAAGPYWQILRKSTTEATVAVMADAINEVPNADYVAADPTHASYSSEGMEFVSAEADGGKLIITWEDHPMMGWPVPNSTDTHRDLLQLFSLALTTEDPGVLYRPAVYGRSDPDSFSPSQAYLAMWLDDPASWVNTGVITVADTNDLDLARAYFVVRPVTSFVTADHTYQIAMGSTPTRETLLQVLEDMTYGRTNALLQAPDPTDPDFIKQLGIGDIRFRARDGRGGLFFRLEPGSSGNAAWLYQSVASAGSSYSPIPPASTWTQFVGGGDGISGLDGPADVPGIGDYGYAWAWYRALDKARSAIGHREKLLDHGGGPIGIVGWATPEDPGVDFHRLLRTLVNGLGDYFKVDDVLIQGPPQPSYVDDKSDFQIAGAWGSLLYEPRKYRTRAAGYPENHRFLARHQGSIWGGGLSRSAPQSGTCSFVAGSDVVSVASPLVPTRLWVGRYIHREGSTRRYVVVSVDESTAEVKLGEDYEGETESAALFVCEDERAAFSTYKATNNFHNQWPARPIEGTDGTHKDGVTGFLARKQAIYVWTRSATWVITGSAAGGYAIEPISSSVGLINQRCLVTHEGVAYYIAGPAGIYSWDFRSHPVRLSNPPFIEAGQARGIQDTIDRINWDAMEWAHGIPDADNRFIRWFVPVDGSEYPNYVITLDLKSGTFGEDDCPPITASTQVLLPDGGWAVVSGDAEGRVWMHDVGDSDGVFGIEPHHTVASSDTRSVTLTAPITDQIVGGGVVIVNDTTRKVQRAWISKHDGAVLTFREDLEWAPAPGDLVVLGAIDQELQPNRFDAGVKDEEKMVPVMWVHAREEDEGEYYLTLWDETEREYLEPLFDSAEGSLAAKSGSERFRVNMRGVELGFRIRTFEPGFRPMFRRFELQMVVRAKPQQAS